MKKSLLLTIAVLFAFVGSYNLSFAAEKPAAPVQKAIQSTEKHQPPVAMKNHGAEFNKHFSKEEMAAKKLEFEKRLNLTEEQKAKIEANKIKDKEKIKPVIEKLKANKEEMIKLKQDTTLSDAEKMKKIEKLKKENNNLKSKADAYRQENMKKFEAILTDEQKVEFAKIKEEQKQKMEEFRKNHPHPKHIDGFKPPVEKK